MKLKKSNTQASKSIGRLNDTSPMPFGNYERVPMQDVPVRYLHWLWQNGMKEQIEHPVHIYIKESLNALKLEAPDLIWS